MQFWFDQWYCFDNLHGKRGEDGVDCAALVRLAQFAHGIGYNPKITDYSLHIFRELYSAFGQSRHKEIEGMIV